VVCFAAVASTAGGIRGKIINQNNESLPYAGITVKNTPHGTLSNGDGIYELSLAPGNYEIEYQFLGYHTIIRKVIIDDSWKTIDVTMEEQIINLQEAHVGKNYEDPAYSV